VGLKKYFFTIYYKILFAVFVYYIKYRCLMGNIKKIKKLPSRWEAWAGILGDFTAAKEVVTLLS